MAIGGSQAQPWEPPAELAGWLAPPALAALVVQNGCGAGNAERRAWVAAGRYIDPFEAPGALLSRFCTEVRWGREGCCPPAGWLAAGWLAAQQEQQEQRQRQRQRQRQQQQQEQQEQQA